MDEKENKVDSLIIDISQDSYDFIREYAQNTDSCLSNCLGISSKNKNIDVIIKLVYKNVNLTNQEKELLLIRYITIMNKIESKYKKNSKYYTLSSLFVNISSILVTAFISINNFTQTSQHVADVIWWIAWSLSLGISLINTIGAFYKWDRKYLLMFKIYYKLEQELWMYLGLVGPYKLSKYNNNQNENHNYHRKKLTLFTSRIESIYKKVNDNLLDIEENDQDKEYDKDNINKDKIRLTSESQYDNQTEYNNTIMSPEQTTTISKKIQFNINNDNNTDNIRNLNSLNSLNISNNNTEVNLSDKENNYREN